MTPTVSGVAGPVEYAADRRAASGDAGPGIRQAAQQFEALFLDMMLRAMREAQGGDDALFGSSAVSSYQAMMDSQLSDALAGQGRGFGVADLLERSLAGSGAPGGAQTATPFALPVERIAMRPLEPASPRGDTVPDSAAPAGHRAAGGLQRPGEPEAFVEQLYPLAKRHGAELGVPAEVLLAQAALETGWGAHIISDATGASSHNLFGIKATAAWQGERTAHRTVEFSDGIARRQVEPFRVYTDFDAAFADYVALIKGSPRYAEALARSEEPGGYLRELQAAGYATDPHYADKILAILDRLPISAEQAPFVAASGAGDPAPLG